MEAPDTRQVEQQIEALRDALDEARFRHVAGIESEPSLVPLFRAHSLAAHKDTLAVLRQRNQGDLARQVAGLRAERFAAEDEELWRASESGALVRGLEGPVSLAEAERALVRERDRDRRSALGRSIDESLLTCSASREAAIEKRARARTESGLAADWEAVVQGDEFLAVSDDAYRDVLSWLARRNLGLLPYPQGDLSRADLMHLFTLPEYEGCFPARELALVLQRAARGLGGDLNAIRIDEADRPTQWPGAHALGPRVSLRRLGGATDWLELFRAVGEALAASRTPGHLRESVWVSTFGSLFLDLLFNPAFLIREVGIERKLVPDLLRVLVLRRLFQLRARAAALRVSTEVERGLSGEAWHQSHRQALTSAALASWRRGDAARESSAEVQAAILKGAAQAETLRDELIERFDEDYWRNPRTAEMIAGLTISQFTGPASTPSSPPSAAEALIKRMEVGR